MIAMLLTLFVAPLVWSGAVVAVRAAFNRHDTARDDAGEKLCLAILLLPVATGLALVVASRFVPIHLPAMPVAAPVFIAPAAHPAAAAHLATPSLDLARWLFPAVLAIYALGVLVRAIPLLLAFARLRRVVNLARLREVAGEAVYVTAGEVPPLAWSRDIILLPDSLTRRLGQEELALMIRHEREHLHRGDTLWFAALAWIDAFFWFNPFVRLQTGRCRTAAELACDAAVTRAAPALREVYAGLLVETLKHAAGDVRQYAPAVISNCTSGDYRMRLKEIMHAGPSTRKPRPWFYAVLAAAAVPLVFGQLAWSQGTSGPSVNVEPVRALADGTVTKVAYVPATDPLAIVTAHGPKDRTTVDIDYGDGITSQFVNEGQPSFKVGDHVTFGQKLAEDGFPMTVTVQTCFGGETPANCTISLSGNNGRSLDEHVSVMWGDVIAKARGHVIHADIAFTDATAKTIELDNHVRIEWTPATDSGR